MLTELTADLLFPFPGLYLAQAVADRGPIDLEYLADEGLGEVVDIVEDVEGHEPGTDYIFSSAGGVNEFPVNAEFEGCEEFDLGDGVCGVL